MTLATDTSIEVWYRPEPRQHPCEIVLSVIIPTLCEEHALQLLLERLRGPSEQFGIEVIVSDGGSRDGTIPLAKRYADIVVTYRGTHQQTIAEGRNLGAAHAHGSTLMFINADVIPANDELFWNTAIEWARGNGSYACYAALAAPVEVVPSERRWSDTIVHRMFNTYLSIGASYGLGVGRGECQLVRRWLFDRLGGYNGLLAAGEDFELFHRARRWTRVAIPRELLVYESSRRYRYWGYGRTLFRWFINWIAVLILRRSISRRWEPIR